MLGFCLALIDEPNDKEKFAEIYSTYKEMMFCKALSILHNEAVAEEAVQESFLRIAKNISKISDVKCNRTAAFVIIIVRNTALNCMKAEHTNDKECLNFEAPPISSDTLKEVFSELGFNYLVNKITSLDLIYSDILSLKLLHQYSISEICSILDIPEKTAESRLYRGKKILAKSLEDYYNENKAGNQ